MKYMFPDGPPPDFEKFLAFESNDDLSVEQREHLLRLWSQIPDDKKETVWNHLKDHWATFRALRESVRWHAPDMAHEAEFKSTEFLELLCFATNGYRKPH